MDDLLAVLDEVAEDRAWLVGSSAGGGLALDAALVAPERTAGLVLFAPAVSGFPEPELDPDMRRFDELLEMAIGSGDLDEVNRLETWLWLDGPAATEGRVTGPGRALALEMNAIILGHDAPEDAGANGVDAWSRLEDVQAPCLVACGDRDVAFMLSSSENWPSACPTAVIASSKAWHTFPIWSSRHGRRDDRGCSADRLT